METVGPLVMLLPNYSMQAARGQASNSSARCALVVNAIATHSAHVFNSLRTSAHYAHAWWQARALSY